MVSETFLASDLASDTGEDTRPACARDSSLGVRKFPPPCVLVVDDEALVRWSVAETLGARGYQTLEAGSAAEAIDILMREPGIGAVLLDVLLPDNYDLSLLATLRRMAPAVPVILMTAFSTNALIEGAWRLGAFTVLNKPFEMNEIAPLIREAMLANLPN